MKSQGTQRRASRNRRRILALQGVFVAGLGLVGWRIQYVQHRYGPGLLTQAAEVQQTTQTVLAQRGSLLDRNGHPLAYDVPAYMMDIRTGGFTDLAPLANQLASILNQPSSDILALLQKGGGHWVRWPSPVMEPDKEKIQQLLSNAEVMGKDHSADATFTPTEERVYPYNTFAANTLGYVTHDGTGASGLEAQYNSVLSGQNGEVSYTRDIWGFPLQTTMQTLKPAVSGQDVELTIDQTIQGFVEAKMDELVNKYHPDHAAIIVMNPNNGEILGMASRPTYNPNEYWNGSATALSSNWAVNEAFEPGSTFKMVTLTAGLATHTTTLNDTFTSGHTNIAGTQINDWNGVGWGVLNYAGAMEYSSNVGFAKLAEKLGWSNLLEYMKKFGFMNKTGIDLPAEATSILFPKSYQGPVQLATSGFGQGISVTPLQQMMAYGAIANGGELIRPHLGKAIIDSQTDKVVKTFQPQILNPQVVPKDVIAQVNDTLIKDVSIGIDNIGYLPGYDVAGKTGTAQVADTTGHYYADRFNVSFLGYAPGWAPKVEVYVTLYWPKTSVGNEWGSTIATPAARDILKECMDYYHVEPKSGSTNTKTSNLTTGTMRYVETPNITGMTTANAQATLKKLGLAGDWIETGPRVKSQWPSAGVEVPDGSKMYILAPNAKDTSLKMPDLTGVSMRQAGDILATMGISMKPQGQGFAVSQSIPPGQPVSLGSTVTVQFAAPEDPVDKVLASLTQANQGNQSTTGSTGG